MTTFKVIVLVTVVSLTLFAAAAAWRLSLADALLDGQSTGDASPSYLIDSVSTETSGSDNPSLHKLPPLSSPVSPALVAVVDRDRTEDERLRVLLDGSLVGLERDADVLALRRLLRDASEGDTLRNEVANALRRFEVVQLQEDLRAVIDDAANGNRFRSFAVQHLGVDFVDDGGGDDGLRRLLHDLTGPGHHASVRREALWSLAQVRDAQALQLTRVLLADGDAIEMHDLAARIAGMAQLTDTTAHLHALLQRPAAQREAPLDGDCCGAVKDVPASAIEPNRLAALRALVALGDAAVQPLLEAAVTDANPHVQTFARHAVAQRDAEGDHL